jgi:type 1 glutamine amidotransferase
MEEIQPFLESPRHASRKLTILLVAGPKDHGPGEHDYPLWQARWDMLLHCAENVSVEKSFGWPAVEQLARADLMVMYSNNSDWSQERARELDKFLERGGGLTLIHYAVDGHEEVDALSRRIGLAWRGEVSKYRHGPIELKLHQHPVTERLRALALIDESYWDLIGDPKAITWIASSEEEGADRPLMWTRERGKGRIFVSIPGHYTWTFDDPLFRLLVFRGMMWSVREPIDRLAPLAPVGARIIGVMR